MTPGPSKSATREQARALAWEEARVGGAIAGACAGVAAALLIYSRILLGATAWERGDYLTVFAGLWVPLILAVLLVLNPDFSGHLAGGFSKRILRFPVATPLAVAVTLVSRTLILLIASSAINLAARALFHSSPGFGLVLFVLSLYFAAQFIDWLRGPVSGLTSLVALGLTALAVRWLWPGASDFAPVAAAIELSGSAPFEYPAALLIGGVAVYAASVVVVRVDRAGLRYGIPEIWEWPRSFARPGAKVRGPFNSALAAQVWFEVRRSRFLLPIIAFSFFGVSCIAAWWVDLSFPESWDRSEQINLATTVGAAVGLFFGAIAHGIQTRVIGFRGASGKPGYEYLQPLTDAQFALARVVAALLLLVPTLLLAATIHYLVAGWPFVSDLLPKINNLGVSPPREIAWMFLARLLLAAIIMIALLGIGTRLLQSIAGASLLALILVAFVDGYIDTDFLDTRRDLVMDAIAVALIVTTAVLLGSAALLGWMTHASLGAWIAVWAALAWLLRYPIATQWVLESISMGDFIKSFLSPFAMASFVPLLYAGILRDVHRRRHSTSPRMDPSVSLLNFSGPTQRTTVVVASAGLAVAALWLGWPATPRYVEFLHAQGNPASLAEIEPKYVKRDPRQNPADRISELIAERARYERAFDAWFRVHGPEVLGWTPSRDASPERYFHYTYLTGHRNPIPSAPLAKGSWDVTEAYWDHVTSTIAPQLREISDLDLSVTRFPIDFSKGFQVEVEHLAPLRTLSRELHLDALHWSIRGDPDRALDDVYATLRLSDALLNEPMLISQLVRFAIIGNALDTAETVLNRALLDDTQLLRLQALTDAIDFNVAHEAMRRGLVFETVALMDISNLYALVAESYTDRTNDLFELASRLAFPADAQRAVLSLDMDRIVRVERPESWPEFDRWQNENFDQREVEARQFIAPVVQYLTPSYTGVWHSGIHAMTRLDLLRTAAAVERFRLANGRLPDTLTEVVPRFLAEVPADRFSETRSPVGYVVRDNGDVIVYSVARDGDDGTRSPRYPEDPEFENHGDTRVTVAPYEFRAGPQIEP